ncbi:carotenoid ester lipase precursor [Flagelloscypha sp. PMI_526]|nr:carotenoid ester lipase precursor [Flagelloscypha sp. PMI_526]
MQLTLSFVFTTLTLLTSSTNAFILPRADPVVQLDGKTVTGKSSGSVSQFLGIPYALPPTGDRRLALPEAHPAYTEDINAKNFGFTCPQHKFQLPKPPGLVSTASNFLFNSIYGLAAGKESEDCLTINVMTPAGAKPGDNLPVLVWHYPGGFTIGATTYFAGEKIVKTSQDINQPTIYVSMNYRVSAFGFMPGKEVKAAGMGNLGLQDQREAYRWIQKYIGQFGGDKTKVTIFGESSGGVAVNLQMLTNGGETEGLFRGAVMMSGNYFPIGDIEKTQSAYDTIVAGCGCSGSADTLQCLREGVPGMPDMNFPFTARVDGNFLKDLPQNLIEQGSIANIPAMSGNMDDEGTIYTLALTVKTGDDYRNYIKTFWKDQISDEDLEKIISFYPDDASKGAPFGTPGWQATLGDIISVAPRRWFTDHLAAKQPVWSWNNRRDKFVPILGSMHGADALMVHGDSDFTRYVIQFANHLDPVGDGNKAGLDQWPKFDTTNRQLMEFRDGLFNTREVIKDDFRLDNTNFLSELSKKIQI